MFNGMISGKYNSSAVVKNKNKKAYRSIYIVMDEDNNLLGFEGNHFANIEVAVTDVVKYLKSKDINGDFVLKFNSSKISINQNSDIKSIVDNYLKHFRDDIYNVNL